MPPAASVVVSLDDLPPDTVRTDPADLAPHLTEWRGQKTGHAGLLLLPRCTDDVVEMVRWASRHSVALVPQGGNTGLVGGSVPEPLALQDGRPVALVSLRRMDSINAVDAAALSLVAGAGAILSNVQAAAEAAGCRFPLSLGAKGSATVGGLVSTNAGGVQVLRHGPMRSLVLGLEAVLPDGSRLEQLSALRKDNTGYDLKQLLIGAEGTLGIVTRVALRLAPPLAARSTAWAAVASPQAALALLGLLRTRVGERVESFELISEEAYDVTLVAMPGARAPLAGRHRAHLLIDLEAEAVELEAVLSDALTEGLVEDAVVAASQAQADAMWALREGIPEAEKRAGGAIKNDISVPVPEVPAFDREARAMLQEAAPTARPLVFGHLGDGNLHWNIRPPVDAPEAWLKGEGEKLRERLHDLVVSFGGSISAEHGIGTLKAGELARLGSPAKLAAMRAIKKALDPLQTMNPGKLFR
jgi:FAD/FMN-containing dehydrogenase